MARSIWLRLYRRLTQPDRRSRVLEQLGDTGPESVVNARERIIRAVGEALDADVRLVYPEALADEMPSSEQSSGIWHLSPKTYGGPAIVAPLDPLDRRVGLLVAVRHSEVSFDDAELALFLECSRRAARLLKDSLAHEGTAAAAILAERARLAREIHDGIAQHLAFLKMRVARLARTPETVDATQLSEMEEVLEIALAETRYAITTLRANPHGMSASEAIQGYVVEFGGVSGLAVSVDLAPFCPEVSPETRVQLLRIVQEALNNVRKHAGATRIDVDIWPRDDGIEIALRDNGIGFTEAESLSGHFGLAIMRERAESVGGRLQVLANEVAGTTVLIWVPSADVGSEAGT